MENIEYITKITYIFFIYLVMAIFIERFVEIWVAVFNYIDMKLKWQRIWNRKAHAYRDRFDRIFASHGDRPEINKMLLWVLWRIMSDKPYAGGKDAIAASLIRLNYLRIGVRFLSFILSVVFVLIIKNIAGFDLLAVFNELIPDSKPLIILSNNKWISVFVASIAVSLGSEPLHQLIKRIENIGEQKRKLKGGTNGSV